MKLPVKSQNKETAAQIRLIRDLTGIGLLHAKKVAFILNNEGFVTYSQVHTLKMFTV